MLSKDQAMTGKFGTQQVLLSYCEWSDYSNIPFANEQDFRDYFSQDWFMEQWDEDERDVDVLMDLGFLGYEVKEVIGT